MIDVALKAYSIIQIEGCFLFQMLPKIVPIFSYEKFNSNVIFKM
jgi:hypothetical protein